MFSEREGIKYFDFNKLIPMPEELKDTVAGGTVEQDVAKYIIIKLKDDDELLKYIKSRFLNSIFLSGFEIKLGMKCRDVPKSILDLYDQKHLLNDNILEFQTAWSPPMKVIEALAQKYPDREIIHEWADEDIGSNTGKSVYWNGELALELFEINSQEAYEEYVKLWGETCNLKQDENGMYHYVSCDECGEC